MRELWRGSLELLRRHPVLLLPLACASLSSYSLTSLRKFLWHRIVASLTTSHSVLGGTVPVYDPDYRLIHKAAAISAPIGYSINFAIACGYTLAFFCSAMLVSSTLTDARCDSGGVLKSVRARWKPILIFTLKLFILAELAVPIITIAMLKLLDAAHRRGLLGSQLANVESILAYSLMAWLLIPSAIRLVAKNPKISVPPNLKRTAFYTAVLAEAASLAINLLLPAAATAIARSFGPDEWLWQFVLWPAATIAGDLPLAFLWATLALVAYQDLLMPAIPSPS